MRLARVLALAFVLTACGAPPTHVEAAGPIVRPLKVLPDTPTTTSSTTSTTERPVVYRAAQVDPDPAPPAVITGSSLYGQPCGGDLPPCWVARREGARGDPRAVNRTGCSGRTCGGIWQFDPVTYSPSCSVSRWHAGTCALYRGHRYAHEAPVGDQHDRARELWDHGRGCSHWGACPE